VEKAPKSVIRAVLKNSSWGWSILTGGGGKKEHAVGSQPSIQQKQGCGLWKKEAKHESGKNPF